MRIGLVGYGRMGKMIREQAFAAGHEVPVIVDPCSTAAEVTARELTSRSTPLDVIIDFSETHVVVDNIERYGELKIPAVIGTTGWYDQIKRVAAIVENSGIGLVWSGNFSLGVNIFFQLVKSAAKIMNRFSQYDAMVHEYHHRHKSDSPSGTAQMIGEIMVLNLDRKTGVTSELHQRRIEKSELHISSTRGGSVPGTHQVIFDSDVDTIVLEHSARSREGFAEGAVIAAEWVCGKNGMFHIDDMMNSIIGGVNDR